MSSAAQVEPVDHRPDARPWGDLLLAVGIRLVMMLAQLVVVRMMRSEGQQTFARLQIWDALRYASLARTGYPSQVVVDASGQLVTGAEFAFFPVYPVLVSLIAHLMPFGYLDAAVAVAWICSLLLGPAAYLLARDWTGSRRAGLLAAALIGLLPMSIVFEMGYAESLFTLLVLVSFHLARRGRWGWAGVALFVAALTRPVGHVVAAGLLVYGVQQWRQGTPDDRRAQWRVLVAGAAALLAAPLFWLFAAVKTGRATAWFDVQRAGWGTSFDGGRATWTFLSQQVFGPSDGPAQVACAAVLLGWVGVLVATWSRRWAPFAVMVALALATVAGSSNYWHSKPRLLLVAALAVVPASGWLARQPGRVVAALLLVGAVATWWFGAYMVTLWPYAM